MASKQDRTRSADLERANAELTASLESCRQLLAECRSKLAANANDPTPVRARREEDRSS
jgi:hypothetical protein